MAMLKFLRAQVSRVGGGNDHDEAGRAGARLPGHLLLVRSDGCGPVPWRLTVADNVGISSRTSFSVARQTRPIILRISADVCKALGVCAAYSED